MTFDTRLGTPTTMCPNECASEDKIATKQFIFRHGIIKRFELVAHVAKSVIIPSSY